ncbi:MULTISPECIES: low-complexity tail membrane protein [unclassified Leptolyngbya]|uniref:low-complexity tail membrane protein n=1 Tax=unclassified Leptolyngbya TaxID=2650499 RepID=UPI001687B466|nr:MULTISPECIES: low-complexity tail membrane protein [unclassified Leptolyngbya]MBD1912992.1 low-complexity tail membrane protein [Leptolyngbya sp. FACHB-8]MBD2155697.1 low-complexity tail membrane protein [Leptolyngbya sp. FACHB-16]
MRAFWSDPYLWLHLAGLATVPLWLEICLLGLAVGDPVLPVWLEVLLVAGVGIVPILWMQWQKPFCIFSLLFLSVAPIHMTEGQRRLLRLFKGSFNQLLAIPVAVGLLVVLWQLYLRAPLVASVAPFDGQRWFGLGLAAIAFFFANLFTQVPVSVLGVMVANDAKVNRQEPYPTERIGKDFTLLGIRLKRILPMPESVVVPTPSSTLAATDGESPSPDTSVVTSAEVPHQTEVAESSISESSTLLSDQPEEGTVQPEGTESPLEISEDELALAVDTLYSSEPSTKEDAETTEPTVDTPPDA